MRPAFRVYCVAAPKISIRSLPPGGGSAPQPLTSRWQHRAAASARPGPETAARSQLPLISLMNDTGGLLEMARYRVKNKTDADVLRDCRTLL